jgi:hypothetical protein
LLARAEASFVALGEHTARVPLNARDPRLLSRR